MLPIGALVINGLYIDMCHPVIMPLAPPSKCPILYPLCPHPQRWPRFCGFPGYVFQIFSWNSCALVCPLDQMCSFSAKPNIYQPYNMLRALLTFPWSLRVLVKSSFITFHKFVNYIHRTCSVVIISHCVQPPASALHMSIYLFWCPITLLWSPLLIPLFHILFHILSKTNIDINNGQM